MELEKSLELEILEVVRNNREEILKDKDWWYGLDNYDINVFQEEEYSEFKITIYKLDSNGEADYNNWKIIPTSVLNKILFS
jgi:hypothetical protein